MDVFPEEQNNGGHPRLHGPQLLAETQPPARNVLSLQKVNYVNP